MFGGACGPDHSRFFSKESALGYESGMMIIGYDSARDGLKGGRGVISSNHNKGRALGLCRLGMKRLLSGKSSRCHCTCRTKQCHWSPQFDFYLFMSNTGIWIRGGVGRGSSLDEGRLFDKIVSYRNPHPREDLRVFVYLTWYYITVYIAGGAITTGEKVKAKITFVVLPHYSLALLISWETLMTCYFLSCWGPAGSCSGAPAGPTRGATAQWCVRINLV